MSQTQKSPLARLVLFMVCLAIAGSLLAGLHYFAVDLPAQKNLHPPKNFYIDCNMQFDSCIETGGPWPVCDEELMRCQYDQASPG